MNRYMHCDFYPEFHVNFIKKGSVNDVPPVTLKDMGFDSKMVLKVYIFLKPTNIEEAIEIRDWL